MQRVQFECTDWRQVRFNPHPPLMVDATTARVASFALPMRFQSPSTVDGGCNSPRSEDAARACTSFNPHPPLMVDATSRPHSACSSLLSFQSPSTVDGGCNLVLLRPHTVIITGFNPHPPLMVDATPVHAVRRRHRLVVSIPIHR